MNRRGRLLSHGHHVREDGQGCIEGMRGTRPGAQAVFDRIEFFLRVDAQISTLGQVLAQQSIGGLARAALQWAVRVAEVDLHISLSGAGIIFL